MNSRLKIYDKKVADVTARLQERDREARSRGTSAIQGQMGEPSTFSHTKDLSRDRERKKSGARPKTDTNIDHYEAPPAKVLRAHDKQISAAAGSAEALQRQHRGAITHSPGYASAVKEHLPGTNCCHITRGGRW